MSLVVGRLLAQLDLDDSQYRKGMDDARTSMQRVDQQSNTTSQQVRKVGTSMQQVGGQAAQGMGRARSEMQQTTQSANNLRSAGDFAKKALAGIGLGLSLGVAIRQMGDAITAARLLGAQTNQLTVLFGNNATSITAWGKTAADTMRMSQREAQAAAIQFATFGKAAGLSGDQLMSFSKQQTKLAADLASFAAIPTEQAVMAMGSAYAGQTEVMRQYGVLLDENTLKTVAYKHGIAGLKGDLTAQQKVQATYYAMQEQLAHVNGDVERSNGKFGASLKTLKTRFEETQAEIGNRMIPVAQTFVDLMAGPGLGALGGTASMIAKLGSAFASLPGPIQAALGAVVAYRTAQYFAGDQMATFGTKVAGLGTAFTNLGQTATVQTANGTVAMGRFGSSIANIGGHVPVLARMQTAFVNAAVGAQRLPRTAGAAAAAMTGMRSAASGLIGALGGPWGLAIAGASVALSMWMQKKQRDAEASRQAAASTEQWAGTIAESGGKITRALRTDIFKELNNESRKFQKTGDDLKTMMETLGEAGVSSEQAVNAVLKQGNAYDEVRGKLQKLQDEQGGGRADTFYGEQAIKRLDELAGRYDKAKSDAEKLARVNGDTSISFDKTSVSVGAMSKAMADFEESTDGAQSKVDGLAKALKGLTDDSLTQEEALQAWADGLRDLVKTLGETGQAQIKADGHIDVTTEAGSKLQDTVRKQGDAYKQAAAAAFEFSKSQGQSTAQALDAVRAKLGPMRQEFINTMMAQGRTAEEARRMADVYLGLPQDIVMRLNVAGAKNAIDSLKAAGVQAKALADSNTVVRIVDNTPEVRAKLDQLKVKYSIINGQVAITDNSPNVIKALNDLGLTVKNLPAGFIDITDTAPESIKRMKELGLQVTTLPNGRVVVDASTEDAQRKIEELKKTERKQIIVDMVEKHRASGSPGTPYKGEYIDQSKQRKASGGPIVGKGGPRTDDVLFWGSNGEWVHQAAAVNYYGPQVMDDINHRRIPRWMLGTLPMRADGGPLGPGKANEDGLQPNAIRASRIVSEKWPQIQSIGGRRDDPYPDHPSGQAIDIMIPDPTSEQGIALGNDVRDFFLANADALGVESMIWRQMFIPAKGTPNMMEDRGSPTQNHMDHVHLLTKAGELVGGGDVGDVPGGIDIGSGTHGGDYNSYSGGDDGNYSYGGSSSGRGGVIPNANIPGVQNVYVVGGQLSGGGGGGSSRNSSSGRSRSGGSYSGSRGGSAGPSASQMQGYSDNIDKLKRDKERAIEDERIKQMRVDELKSSGKAKPSQIASAENALAKARDRTQTITDKIAQAESKLGEAKDKRSDALQRQDDNRRDRYSRMDNTSSGRGGGRSYRRGGDPMAARGDVDRYSRDLERAKEDERIKQMRLDELKASGTAKESQIAAAENQLNKAKDRTLTITEKLRQAELELGETRQGGMPGRRGGSHVANFSSKYLPGLGPTQIFGTGGTVRGLGTSDTELTLLTPGEEVIRRQIAERPGIRRFLKQLNAGQVQGFAGGGTVGFGGYTTSTRDSMAPKNFYDWLTLGVGGASAAASMAAPYIDMLATGQVNLGSMAPTLDTKSNSFPTAEAALAEIGGQLQEQLAQIIRALHEGKNIHVVIQGDQGNSAARMVSMRSGM